MMVEKINMPIELEVPLHIAKRLGYKPLNQNQKIVLEWLKEEKRKNKELTAFGALSNLFRKCDYDNELNISSLLLEAMLSFSREEQFQLLAEFAKWGLGEVE